MKEVPLAIDALDPAIPQEEVMDVLTGKHTNTPIPSHCFPHRFPTDKLQLATV